MSSAEEPAPWPFVPMRDPPRVVAAEGSWLETAAGERVLDAAGGAIAVNVGHCRHEVADAVHRSLLELSYAVPPWETPSRRALVERLRERWLPPGLDRVYLACSGSEAVEAAVRTAVHHFGARGEPERTQIVARSLAYHGTTLATTGIGGHAARRAGLEALLQDFPRAPTPYPLRSPYGPHAPRTGRWCVDELERTLEAVGPERVAAFVAEPIVGASGGALVPPDDYWPAVRALLDRHGILLIADEVMTGFGRTGKPFALEHWGVIPDLLVAGKGLAGGYAAINGVFASEAVIEPLRAARRDVMFHTFGGHPAACAAAHAVLGILEDEALVARAAEAGERLAERFAEHPHVAECRGRGLLQAIEVVRDRETLEPFPAERRLTSRIVAEGLARGVFFYPGGTGEVRDVICLGPPFTITDEEIDHIATTLRDAVDAALAGAADARTGTE